MKIEKIDAKIDFSAKNAVKNKNAPFFMIFPNISFFHMVVTDWTGPLIYKKDKNFFKAIYDDNNI